MLGRSDKKYCEMAYNQATRFGVLFFKSSHPTKNLEERFGVLFFKSAHPTTKASFPLIFQICRRPLVKDCEVAGEPVCRTAYESECWTKQEEHNVSPIFCFTAHRGPGFFITLFVKHNRAICRRTVGGPPGPKFEPGTGDLEGRDTDHY